MTPEIVLMPRQLVAHDVAAPLDQHLVAALREDADADRVAHRAGRHEEGRLLAEHLGRLLLEAVDRRVLAVDVVADLGRGHRGAHLGGGTGHGVGAQVDRLHDRRR